MIITIRGVLGAADLSGFLDRVGDEPFEVEAAVGSRLDTCSFTLFDPDGVIAIPPRAEIVIYDADPSILPTGWAGFLGAAPIVDPPGSNTQPLGFEYDAGWTYDAVNAPVPAYDTQPPASSAYDPHTWTPRLFGGYVASAEYSVEGPQRTIRVTCQDYTVLNKFTVVNRGYGVDALHPLGWTDQQIVRDIFLTYRPEIDVSNVQQVLQNYMPGISFPVHTIEQFMTRVLKITQANFRIDYYKRLKYNRLGQVMAPFGIAAQPNMGNANLVPDLVADISPNANGWAPATPAVLAFNTSFFAPQLAYDGTVTQFHSPGALKITSPAGTRAAGLLTGPNYWLVLQSTATIPVPPASYNSVTMSLYARADTAARNIYLGWVALDANNNVLQVEALPGQADTVGAWSRSYFEADLTPWGGFPGVVPAATTRIGFLALVANPLDGEVHWIDAVQFTMTPTPVPFALTGGVGYIPTFPSEDITYNPDASALVDRVWVIGGTYYGPNQTYKVAGADGTVFAFGLPDRVQNARSVAVTVNGVDQGNVGVLGIDGTLDNPGSFTDNVLIGGGSGSATHGSMPPIVAFKTPPPAGADIRVTATFVYPLIQVVTDQAKLAAAGDVVWESVVRDKRIDNEPLAQQVATAHLNLEGTAKAAGTMTLKYRSLGGLLLEPGQGMFITNPTLFKGLLSSSPDTLLALVLRMTTTLTDDTAQPYEITVDFSDRPDLSDDDLFDHLMGEQARINAALEQSDVNGVVQDEKLVTEKATAADTITGTLHAPSTYTYDGTAHWDYGTYA